MKWNTQRKAVVALLVLAGAALCVDRFVLGYGPPSAATVAPIESTADILASAPAGSGAAPATKASVRTVSLADRVARLGPDADFRGPPAGDPDAMIIPASWTRVATASERAALAAAGAPVTIKDTETFNLSSVFAGPHVPVPSARINGRLIRVGQKISGHELLRIEHERGKNFVAVLRGRDADSEIRVPLVIGGDNTPPPGPDASEETPTHARS